MHRLILFNRPIEASVILLPVFELVHENSVFCEVLIETIPEEKSEDTRFPPFLFTLLTLSSYIFAHANSSPSPRALAYANLTLHILLSLVEKDALVARLYQPTSVDIWICRQVRSFDDLTVAAPEMPLEAAHTTGFLSSSASRLRNARLLHAVASSQPP
jgi:hypothetical protein